MKRLDDFLHETKDGDISKVIHAISAAAVPVWRQIPFSLGLEEGRNPSGDRQTKIDLFANQAFVSSLLKTGAVAEVASEELVDSVKSDGHLHIAMDPLDGSSNASTNSPLGSIFGVYESSLPCSGDSLVAAAFVTYGPMLTITFSLGEGVQRFVAIERASNWSFELLDRAISIPHNGKVFGLGGLRRKWIPPVEKFVASLERRGMKLRYGGTFVGDYNQILRYGGIFGYPALRDKPKGKLRILYETAPMAFITDEAGGVASDGINPILSITPKELAETSPAYLGSGSLVRELEGLIREG